MTEKEKDLLNKLLVCIDLGTSLIKIIYLVNGKKVGYMLIDPEHLALSNGSAEHLPTDAGMGLPEDNAWVRLSDDGKCHLLGRLASDYRAFPNFKIQKWKIATPKILGAIGAIAEREKLGWELTLDLAVLMPYGEIKSAPQLKEELTKALEGFYFRNQEVMVELQRYQCVPEATGVAMKALTGDNALEKNLLYLMFGHRNTSLLCFRRGSFSQSESSTTNLGFYDLINKMADKVSGLDKNRLINAISTGTSIQQEGIYRASRLYAETYTYKYRCAQTSIKWTALTEARENDERKAEIEQLKKAYFTSLDEYWALIANWLNGSLPALSEIDYLVYSGGASQLFIEKLQQYFPKNFAHSPIDYEEELWTTFGLYKKENKLRADAFVKQNLIFRFVDVWRFFLFFSKYKPKKKKKKESAA